MGAPVTDLAHSPNQRHAVITGGGSGIGAAIAASLAAEGYRLTLLGRRLQPLQAVAAQLPDCLALSCDVTEPDSVATALAAAREQFGAVEVLVNCAGAAPTAPFHKIDYASWRAVFNLNVDGVFHCTQAVIGEMRSRNSGRIINIASTAAQRGYAYVSAYSAAKHAVLGLTRSLALELASTAVTINAVCPGYTDTDIIRDAIATIVAKTGRSEQQALQTFTATNPQQRLIQPDEVAATISWLCSDSSRSITGQAISVSGGEVM